MSASLDELGQASKCNIFVVAVRLVAWETLFGHTNVKLKVAPVST
jgi:hypothetical protein